MTRAMRNRGFTLIEMMLVVAIIATASSLVVMALPANSPPKQGREMLARLADAIPVQRMEAMAQGSLLGLSIKAHGYQFMVQDPSRSYSWRAISALEQPDGENITLQLTQQDLLLEESPADERDDKPQLLLFPGGEVTPFELRAFAQKKAIATLIVSEAGEVQLVDATDTTP